jgi:hypothetical protein
VSSRLIAPSTVRSLVRVTGAMATAASLATLIASGFRRRSQVGRNALCIYLDLVETLGFTQGYKSAKRFVRSLKLCDPERFDAPTQKTLRIENHHMAEPMVCRRRRRSPPFRRFNNKEGGEP